VHPQKKDLGLNLKHWRQWVLSINKPTSKVLIFHMPCESFWSNFEFFFSALTATFGDVNAAIDRLLNSRQEQS
jgi:hypothetical protein